MLCVTLHSYSAACSTTSGGVSTIWVFDPLDFDWTQATVSGVVGPYTAVALNTDSTGLMYRVNFQRKEAEFKFKHSINGCSVKYEFDLQAQLPNLSQGLTNFLQSLDAAGCCCGLGIVVQLNSGKIFVIGERVVNGDEIPYFEVKMDGTEGGSGKKFDDFNGANVMFKGEYSRMAYEFTGGASVIKALEVATP